MTSLASHGGSASRVVVPSAFVNSRMFQPGGMVDTSGLPEGPVVIVTVPLVWRFRVISQPLLAVMVMNFLCSIL